MNETSILTDFENKTIKSLYPIIIEVTKSHIKTINLSGDTISDLPILLFNFVIPVITKYRVFILVTWETESVSGYKKIFGYNLYEINNTGGIIFRRSFKPYFLEKTSKFDTFFKYSGWTNSLEYIHFEEDKMLSSTHRFMDFHKKRELKIPLEVDTLLDIIGTSKINSDLMILFSNKSDEWKTIESPGIIEHKLIKNQWSIPDKLVHPSPYTNAFLYKIGDDLSKVVLLKNFLFKDIDPGIFVVFAEKWNNLLFLIHMHEFVFYSNRHKFISITIYDIKINQTLFKTIVQDCVYDMYNSKVKFISDDSIILDINNKISIKFEKDLEWKAFLSDLIPSFSSRDLITELVKTELVKTELVKTELVKTELVKTPPTHSESSYQPIEISSIKSSDEKYIVYVPNHPLEKTNFKKEVIKILANFIPIILGNITIEYFIPSEKDIFMINYQ